MAPEVYRALFVSVCVTLTLGTNPDKCSCEVCEADNQRGLVTGLPFVRKLSREISQHDNECEEELNTEPLSVGDHSGYLGCTQVSSISR